jgi:hypothetical protein
MPFLNEEEKRILGPIIGPFERNNRKPADQKILKDGEKERDFIKHLIHSGEDDKNPKQFKKEMKIKISELDVLREKKGKWPEKCFLWIIDFETIKIIKEKNRNEKRTHKKDCVCHTNLTGGGNAFIGGELYFVEDGRKIISFSSDRYGDPSPEQWVAAKNYFEKVGYTPVIDMIDFLIEEQQ